MITLLDVLLVDAQGINSDVLDCCWQLLRISMRREDVEDVPHVLPYIDTSSIQQDLSREIIWPPIVRQSYVLWCRVQFEMVYFA